MHAYLYQKLTWPEVKQAVKAQKLVLIPVAAIEDHGYHLPVDTDLVIAGGICRKVAERIPDQVVLFPPIQFGYNPHHMDWPGNISIDWDVFIKYGLCITKSLAHHGFKRILMVNGHGSNRPVTELVARLTMVEHPDVVCAAASWWEMQAAREAFAKVRESAVCSHACELETSCYLYLEGEYVQMDKAVKDIKQIYPHYYSDLMGAKPGPEYRNSLNMMPWWSQISDSGVRGDATVATAEKGRLAVEGAVEELVQIVREMRTQMDFGPRVDKHV